MSRNTFFIALILLLGIAFSIGCSGKTTVKEELTDTSPRAKTEGAKDFFKQEPAPSETPASGEQKSGESGETKPSTPAPGTDNGGGGTTPPKDREISGGQSEAGGGKANREKYYNENLAYPGGTQDTNLMSPESPGFTGKTLISNDPPDKIAKWYMDKLGEKATLNKGSSPGGGEQYNISATDRDNGYSANVVISKVNKNSPVRILISLRDLSDNNG